eukprot:339211-Prymnesium_polylepis.1
MTRFARAVADPARMPAGGLSAALRRAHGDGRRSDSEEEDEPLRDALARRRHAQDVVNAALSSSCHMSAQQ